MKKSIKSRKNFGLSLPKEKVVIASLVFFVAILACAVTSAVYFRYKYVNLQSAVHTYPLQNWQPGEIVNDDRFIFSLNSSRTDANEIPHFWELPTGQKFLMVSMSFKNLLKQDYQLSPISYMHFVGDDGVSYKVTSAPYISDSLGGPVRQNQTVKGEVGFTIPSSIKSGDFVFDPSLPDSNQIRVHFVM